VRRGADADAAVVAAQRCELAGFRRGGDHVVHLAALQAIDQIVMGQQQGCRNRHRAQLDDGEHHFP